MKTARIITSEEVKAEILETEAKKKVAGTKKAARKLVKKGVSETPAAIGTTAETSAVIETPIAAKQRKIQPKHLLINRKVDEDSSDEDSDSGYESDSDVDFDAQEKYNEGDYVIIQYTKGKKNGIVYFAAVIDSVDSENELFGVSFFKKSSAGFFLHNENDKDEIGIECILRRLPVPDIKQKKDQLYYFFDGEDITLQ